MSNYCIQLSYYQQNVNILKVSIKGYIDNSVRQSRPVNFAFYS